MEYTLDMVTTIADCDALLATATSERQDLDHRKYELNHSYQNLSSGSAGLDAELSAVMAEINSYEQSLPAFPPGPAKDLMEGRLEKANHRKYLLTVRRKNYGVLALIEKQYALISVDREITENDEFVIAINKRKDQL